MNDRSSTRGPRATSTSPADMVDPSASVRKMLAKIDQMIDALDVNDPPAAVVSAITKSLLDLQAAHTAAQVAAARVATAKRLDIPFSPDGLE